MASSSQGSDVPDPATSLQQQPLDSAARTHAYKLAVASALLLIAAATVFYHLIEDWTWVDSFYFSTIAVTTVGFGDLSPTTDASKLFTVFYVFAGLSLIGVVLNEALRRHAIGATKRRHRL